MASTFLVRAVSQLSVREAPRSGFVDSRRDGMRFIVRADEKLTACC